MKTSALACGLLAAAVRANPTPTEQDPPSKRASIPTVTASGNAFFAGSDRFYIRGVDYQPGGSSSTEPDPLSDPTICQRDIAEFKKLGVNTVRVYEIDNSKSHDTCMNALADAGIYLILDVNNPKYSINRAQPAESYNDVYLQSVFATIDEFVKYDNTLAFFSGNEVINSPDTTEAAPYVKATTRDMRQYIASHGYRQVPCGYSAADISENRQQTADYFNCGTDDERSDFFAFNDYSYCSSSFTESGWDQKVKNFTGYGIPIFLSEYGCIKNKRTFSEVEALMNSEMTGVYSGGLVYQYSEESDNPGYGLVSIEGNSVSELADFTAYSTALANNPAPTGNGGFNSVSSAVACPSPDANWSVTGTLLPAIPTGALKYMTASNAGPGPGVDGDGSQNAGGTSTGDASPGSGSASVTAAASTGTGKSAGNRPAPLDMAGFVVVGVVFMSTLFGTMLL
ncbi:unnamed protein product [Discula destructiva]